MASRAALPAFLLLALAALLLLAARLLLAPASQPAAGPSAVTAVPASGAPTGPEAGSWPPGAAPAEVERAIREALRPAADPREIARRWQLVRPAGGEPMAAEPPGALGGYRRFWLYDPTAGRYVEVGSTLVHRATHADYYAELGSGSTADRIALSAEVFEARTLPATNRLFGLPEGELPPGIERVSVLVAATPGAAAAFNPADALPRRLNPHANGPGVLYVSPHARRPGTPAFDGALAHEYAHLAHHARHPGDDAWLKEALAQLAERRLGFASTDFTPRFLAKPGVGLTAWSSGADQTAHYGAAYLFLDYLTGRLGSDALIPGLMAQRPTGSAAIDASLPVLGRPERFDGLFADWTVANLLADRPPPDRRYGYVSGLAPGVTRIERLSGEASAELAQYGAAYYEIATSGDATLTFQGSETAPVVPGAPTSGSGAWWSNRGDGVGTTLTRPIDLTGAHVATLTASLWWDLEAGWDRAYLLISDDGGETWTPLRGQQTTDGPSPGVQLGPGYTGRSGGGSRADWVRERVDLTPYAGRRLLLRFALLTDAATNGPGFLWDDLAVPEVGLHDDAETAGDWAARGWVRLAGPVPQRFWLHLVTWTADRVEITPVPLDAGNRAQIFLANHPGALRQVLVVAAGAAGTTEPARYLLRLTSSR